MGNLLQDINKEHEKIESLENEIVNTFNEKVQDHPLISKAFINTNSALPYLTISFKDGNECMIPFPSVRKDNIDNLISFLEKEIEKKDK